jgi:hypothetical protein
LTLTYGLRHDLQAYIAHAFSIAPRVGLAIGLDSQNRSRIRVGAGVFHHIVPSAVWTNALRYDGRHRREFVVDEPVFFRDVPREIIGEAVSSRIYRVSSSVTVPRSLLSSVAFERRLYANTTTTLGYTWERGTHRLRNRSADEPAVNTIFAYETTGRSSRHELQVTLRSTPRPRLTFFTSYTASWRRSDTDGFGTTATDRVNPLADDGFSGSDQRHRAIASLSLQLPWQVSVSPFATVASGRPFNITTGKDNNGDSVFNDRPAFAHSGDPRAIVTPIGAFIVDPTPGQPIIPRNLGRESRQARMDLRISKDVRVRGRHETTFTLAAENLLNTVNAGGVVGVVTSPGFGTPRRAGNSRRITLSTGWGF